MMQTRVLSVKYNDAVSWALDLHASQTRKSTSIPYAGHILRVSGLVLEYGADEDTAIAAVLHDAVEDQGGMVIAKQIRVRFGERVCQFVLDCTDTLVSGAETLHNDEKLPWKLRKDAYIEHLKTVPQESRLISCCDKLDNLRCSISTYRRIGDQLWSMFRSTKEQFLWYYKTVCETIEEAEKANLKSSANSDVGSQLLIATADLKDTINQFCAMVDGE